MPQSPDKKRARRGVRIHTTIGRSPYTERNEAIAKERAEGVSSKVLAEKYGLSRTRIDSICAYHAIHDIRGNTPEMGILRAIVDP